MHSVDLNDEFTRRIEGCEAQYFSDRIAALALEEGNPSGAGILSCGGALALRVSTIHDPMHNRLMMPGVVSNDDVIAGVEFVHAAGKSCRIDVPPTSNTVEILPILSSLGFVHCGFYNGHFGVAESVLERLFDGGLRPPPSLSIRRYATAELRQYVECFNDGHNIHPDHRQVIASEFAAILKSPFARMWGAWIDGQLAGVALLLVRGRIGHLASATTRLPFRRLGIHRYLLQSRIKDALTAGCWFVSVHTAVASASQRNLVRFGFHLAYTKAIWTRAASR
ncbi:GNAT family N-acetyltransferase [Ensifer aridi]|uniref:GNAT family N-acetyltransferase n=1 Tax=Ensifer aridi TaxID=1708715 RepID=UPI00111183D3|nr:GNAT family N-acetyltransferase [Ensifer aridi]